MINKILYQKIWPCIDLPGVEHSLLPLSKHQHLLKKNNDIIYFTNVKTIHHEQSTIGNSATPVDRMR